MLDPAHNGIEAALLQVLVVRVLAPAARNAAARFSSERRRDHDEKRTSERESEGQVAASAT